MSLFFVQFQKSFFKLVFIIFLISVYIFLNRDMFSNTVKSDNMAHVQMLISYDNWMEKGAFKSYLSQIDSYSGSGNSGFYYYPRLVGDEGTNYYVSSPSLSLILPYFVAWSLQVSPGSLFLQIFGILLHFIAALFVFFIINHYCRKPKWSFSFEGIIAATTFLFFPILMYGHTMYYQHDIISMTFYIILLYLLLTSFLNPAISKYKIGLIAITVFLFVLTEWIGVLFVFSFILLNLLFKSTRNYKVLIIVITSATIAITAMIIQYSLISGLEAYVKAAFIRYLERSGLFPETYTDKGLNILNPESYYYLAKNIHTVLKGFGYFILGFSLIIYIFFHHKKKGIGNMNLSFWGLLLFPILLCYFVFFNVFVIHYANHSKLALPLPIILGVSLHLYLKIFKSKTNQKIGIIAFSTLYLFVFSYSINEYSQFTKSNNDRNHYLSTAGLFIKKNAKENEAVFINIDNKYSSPTTYLSYMSKKNIKHATNIDEAKMISKKFNKANGVLFTFGDDMEKFSLVRFVEEGTKAQRHKDTK